MRTHMTLARASLTLVLLTACAGADGPLTPGGTVAAIAIVGGNGQSGAAGTTGLPLQVKATDESGRPVPGVAVTWQVTAGVATLSPAATTTGSDGRAATSPLFGAGSGTITVVATAAGVSSGATFSLAGTGAGSAVTITAAAGNVFAPSNVTVSAGTSVTWVWGSGAAHHNIRPVTAGGLPSSLAVRDAPASYTVVFPTPGTYRYFCDVHGAMNNDGSVSGMSGTITVQ